MMDPIPDNPLWMIARQLAKWKIQQGFADYRGTDEMDRRWMGDTNWRDDGILPSGDRFTVWIRCEH